MVKAFEESMTEAFIKEPKELLSYASTDSNGMLLDDVRADAKHWANLLVKSSRNYPSDGSIAKYHTNFINSVNKSHKITDPKLTKILWTYAEEVWNSELEKVGI